MTDLSLEQRLSAYVSLTKGERANLCAEVEATRPDLVGDLTTARALASRMDALAAPDPADSLSRRLVDARLGHASEHVERPEDTERAASIEAMLDVYNAEAEAPLAQFERLTGHVLAPEAVHPSASPLALMRRNGHANGHGHAKTAARAPRADRPAAAPRRRSLASRLGLAGVVVAALYAGVFAGSPLLAPERARVADVEDVAETFRPVRSEASDQYAEAVGLLRASRRSTLGLFPRYEGEGLDAAADAFADVARSSPEGQYGQEAALAIGRIRMLQDRDDDARIALETVVARRSYRAPEAVRLLDYLDARAAAQ